jgi:hypothetical protein
MEQLKEFFYDPKTGFISASKLYLKLNKTIPLATIRDFLKNQKISQISLENRRKPMFKQMNVYSSNDQWQIDLIDYSKYSRWNVGFKYLLCVVDVFSRKAFIVPIKQKSDTTRAMKGILETNKPILIQSDNGTEFLNQHFQTLLKEKNVWHTTAEVGNHNKQGIVERFNRTIEGMISKYQESRKTNRYVNALEDLVYNYNHTFHRRIEDTPERRYNSNPNSGTIIISDELDSDLSVGDKVRILKNKKTFQKGYEAKYSDSVYEIVSGDGYVFTIKSTDDEVLQKKYKYYQLQKINEVEEYEVEAINRPVPKTLKELRNKREIEELGVYTMPTSAKKRKINKPVDLYPIVDGRNQSNKRKSDSIHIGRKKSKN